MKDITKEQFMAIFGLEDEDEEGMILAQEEYDDGKSWIEVAREHIEEMQYFMEA